MGIYVNPGSELFEEALHSQIYVDKTSMLCFLNSVVNTQQKYLAISRPRRFGKTMAANMVCAYYDRSIDSRNLFEGLLVNPENRPDGGPAGAQPAWDQYLNQFNVIRLDMAKFLGGRQAVDECISLVDRRVGRDLARAFPEADLDAGEGLQACLEEAYVLTRQKFVIVIDEWDAPIRVLRDDAAGQRRYLDYLRDLLKDQPYVALAYMTGILPIKKYGEHSALNMFDEYSMVDPRQLAEYVGFTEGEVRRLCERYGRSFDDVRAWYDGYLVRGIVPPHGAEAPTHHVYSPLSVVTAMRTGVTGSYWNETETAEALKAYIRRNYDGLKEDVAVLMQGAHLPVSIRTYQNDMTTFHSKDDILTLLIHLGYLGYDSQAREAFIPNREVAEVFEDTTRDEEWTYLFRALENSRRLLEATWAGDEEAVARMVEDAHMRAGNQTYHSEAALSYAVRLAYYAAGECYTLVPEMQAGKGYADLVYLPAPGHEDRPAMLVELKWGQGADTAMQQILDRRYPEALERYRGNIVLVGIGYDREVRSGRPEYKHHSCRIARA